jgi:hypothetical protein
MEEDHIEIVPMCCMHRVDATIHELLACYNVIEEDQE